jgi:hypothetical protein
MNEDGEEITVDVGEEEDDEELEDEENEDENEDEADGGETPAAPTEANAGARTIRGESMPLC